MTSPSAMMPPTSRFEKKMRMSPCDISIRLAEGALGPVAQHITDGGLAGNEINYPFTTPT